MLTREALERELAGIDLVRRIYFFDEIASTSDWAKSLVGRSRGSGRLHGAVVIANHQTAGRGRFRRRWLAPSGKAALFSVIMRPPEAAAAAQWLGLAAPVAVCEAISRVAGLRPTIKYPNDVMLGGRKAAGILVEQAGRAQHPMLVVGIGVNVNQSVAELPPLDHLAATSLSVEAGCEVRIAQLVGAILRRLEFYAQGPQRQAGSLPVRFGLLCETVGQHVEITTSRGSVCGVALAIASDGALIVRQDYGADLAVYSGDVRQLSPA